MDCLSTSIFPPLHPRIFAIMEHVKAICIVISSVSFALIVAIALPSILVILERFKSQGRNSYDILHKLYEDEDGIASEKSQERYLVRLPRYLVLTSTLVGTFISLGCSIYSSVYPNEVPLLQDWMTFGSWACGSRFKSKIFDG